MNFMGKIDIYRMQCRSFIKNAAFGVVAVSVSGFIHFDGNRYVDDCETTTDIIGPFYRPDAPVRTDLSDSGKIQYMARNSIPSDAF